MLPNVKKNSPNPTYSFNRKGKFYEIPYVVNGNNSLFEIEFYDVENLKNIIPIFRFPKQTYLNPS
ncbi:MAG: hypothetical protein ABH811_02705 [archaeon]